MNARTLALLAVAALAAQAAAVDPPSTTTSEPAAPAPAFTDPALTRAVAPLGVTPAPARLGPGAFRGAPPRFATPPGGTARAVRIRGGLRITLRRPDGSRFAEAEGDPTGYRRLAYYDRRGRLTFAAQAVLAGPVPQAVRVEAVRCGSASASSNGTRVSGTVRWFFNPASTPRRLSVRTVRTHLRNAHVQWAGNRNHCRIPDRSALRFAFQGDTRAAVGLNGRSTIGFGNVSALGCSQARTLACTLTWYRDGTRIVEADIRLATVPPGGRGWATTRRAGFFDVWSVAAHEIGHSIGLGHASGGPDNVMAPSIGPADVTGRRLGRGDATINNRLY